MLLSELFSEFKEKKMKIKKALQTLRGGGDIYYLQNRGWVSVDSLRETPPPKKDASNAPEHLSVSQEDLDWMQYWSAGNRIKRLQDRASA
jgi:hypothetical protein